MPFVATCGNVESPLELLMFTSPTKLVPAKINGTGISNNRNPTTIRYFAFFETVIFYCNTFFNALSLQLSSHYNKNFSVLLPKTVTEKIIIKYLQNLLILGIGSN